MAVLVDNPQSQRDPWSQSQCSDRRVAVVVDGTEIPTTEVNTYVSRDGVADKVTLTEVHFPAEWDDQSVLSEIEQFNPETQSRYSTAKIYWQNPLGEKRWFLHQLGWVRGVGSAGTGEAKMWVDDISNLFSNIPFSAKYDNVRVTEVFKDVRQVVASETIFGDIGTRTPETRTINPGSKDEAAFDRAAFGPAAGFYLWLKDIDPLGDASAVSIAKEFQPNRDTIGDVLNWATDLTSGSWYVDVEPDGTPAIVYDDTPVTRTFIEEETTSVTSEEGAPLKILESNALEEISPYNTATVYGSSGTSFHGFTIKELESGDFPVKTVQYTPLVERTGQSLRPPIYESDATTMKQAENVAREKLLEQLQQSGEGDMFMWGEPSMELGSRIIALPVCKGDAPNTTMVPLHYEVESITHKKKGREEYTTEVNVSVFVDRDKIEVIDQKSGERSTS